METVGAGVLVTALEKEGRSEKEGALHFPVCCGYFASCILLFMSARYSLYHCIFRVTIAGFSSLQPFVDTCVCIP